MTHRETGDGSADKGQGDAHDGDEQGRSADLSELDEVHLHADLHEQQEHTEFRQNRDRDPAHAVDLDQAEYRWPDHNAGHDLAENGRDPKSLGDLGSELGNGQHDEQVEQDPAEVNTLGCRDDHSPNGIKRRFLGCAECVNGV